MTASPRYAVGDVVVAQSSGWQTYSVARDADLQPCAVPPGHDVTAMLGPLGMTGLTAYFGLLDVGRPVAGNTVLVSAAAGFELCALPFFF